MPKTNIGPRVEEKTKKFYQDNFSAVNRGAEYTIESFPILYRRTLVDLKGQFSESEIKLMIDVCNGLILIPQIVGQHLLHNCADGIALDGLDKKWEIEKDPFLEKLKNLSLFQTACLEIWANGFWYGGREENKVEGSGSLEKYIEPLL